MSWHSKLYPLPRAHLKYLKRNILSRTNLRYSVLKKDTQESSWSCISQIILKQDGSAQYITNFQNIDEQIATSI